MRPFPASILDIAVTSAFISLSIMIFEFCSDLNRIFKGTVVSFATPISSRSVNKKARPAPRKAEHEKLAQLWSKQALAAAIAKQLTNQKTVFDSNKAPNAEKVCLSGVVCAKEGNFCI